MPILQIYAHSLPHRVPLATASHVVSVVAAGLFALGWYTKIASAVFAFTYMYYFFWEATSYNNHYYLTFLMFWLFSFLDLDATLRVGMRFLVPSYSDAEFHDKEIADYKCTCSPVAKSCRWPAAEPSGPEWKSSCGTLRLRLLRLSCIAILPARNPPTLHPDWPGRNPGQDSWRFSVAAWRDLGS
eukprot:gene2377-3183_t